MRRRFLTLLILLAGFPSSVRAQQPQPRSWTTAEDHRHMMAQLGIKALRPGPSGNEQDPNHANYDEANANPVPKGRVPVMIMFRPGSLAQTLGRPTSPPAGRPAFTFPPPPGSDVPATQQAIIDGWGFVFLNPASIQADNGAGLTKGVIGLVNKGQPRKPDDWGALRAWAWGASRVLDYLEKSPAVNAKQVGIERVSRYGKAALVTMAFDQRFAAVLIGSSGAGGAKLYRRNWGEAVETLTGSGEYHWMAGNFLKYGAADATFGSRNAGDVGLLDGQLAWRQHGGGHTDGPNWKYFLSWADHFFGRRYTPAPPVPMSASSQPAGSAQGTPRADVPTPRTDSNSMLAHRQLLAKRTQGKIDVYFVGNSITRRWGATDYPDFLANWKANFHGWNAANFGWGADRIEHMLWRIENGELDGVNPKVIVILGGTNNVGQRPGGDAKVADITRGLRALLDLCRRKAPNATIILTGILPRNDNATDRLAVVREINRINENLARFADGKAVRYLNINDRLADSTGKLFDGMTVDGLHLSVKGYQVWADALKPIFTELLGPPAVTDEAPPPTGDPSARRP